MINDIFTILWKEIREMLAHKPNLRGGWLGVIFFVAVFGVFLPLQSGREWLTSPQSIMVWTWVPFILVNSVVADSFAGERERHTLETLLASRLSDRAILFGKIAAAILYGWGLTLISILLGVIVGNIAFWQGRLIFFSPGLSLGILLTSFLVALLAASLGVLVSLRASSVRQAQQTLSIAMFIVIIPLLILPMLPLETRRRIGEFLSATDLRTLGFLAILILGLIDAGLLGVSLVRFQRSRLILD